VVSGGHWDLTDRLSLAFREADLPPFSADRPAFSLSGGERSPALPAFQLVIEPLPPLAVQMVGRLIQQQIIGAGFSFP
jgi:hypothetical protein